MEFKNYFKVKHILAFSSLNYLQAGISFLISILLARYLGTEGYGTYAYGLIFANTLMTVMQFGTDRTLVRDLVQLKSPDLILSAATLIWFLVGLIGLIGITIWCVFSDLNVLTAIVVVLCAISGFGQGLTVSGWFDFKGKMSLQSLYGVVGRLTFLIAIIIIMIFPSSYYTVIYIAAILLVSRMLSLMLEWRFVGRTANLAFKESFSFIKLILKNNIWVWWAAIGNLLMTQVNQFILTNKVGPSELAYYGIAFQSIMLIQILQQQINRLTAPSIADVTASETLDSDRVLRKLKKYCLTSFLSSALILFPLYLITPLIISTFLGDSYLPAIPVMNTLYIWSAFYGMALINNQFLIGLHKQRAYFQTTFIFGVISIFLAFILIDLYQAKGAALSLLIAHSASIIFQFVIVFRAINSYRK